MLEDLCDIALSIDITKSQYLLSSDNHTLPPQKTYNSHKLKCFKCYGKGIQNCDECQSTQQISSSHPLALLLNSVLVKKLLNPKEREGKKEQQFENVYLIKEQEQDLQEKKLTCSYCKCQCDQMYKYCAICPCFYSCQGCAKKNIQHQHQLTRSKVYSTSKIGLGTIHENKRCCNCNKNIENYYSACKTCLETGYKFWVCDICSDHKIYTHSTDHVLETVIDHNPSIEYQHEVLSQELQSEDKSIYLEKDQIEENFDSQQDDQQHRLIKKNSSLDYLVQVHDQDQLPLSFSNKLEENNITNNYVSRVKLDLDEGLFSSFQFPAQNSLNIRQTLCPPKLSYNKQRIFQSSCKENQAKKQCSQFLFSGYRCDMCGVEPIRKVRYHCTSCEDFDVCDNCFQRCIKTHAHITFERIDHEQLKKKAMNKIFQLRDTNLKTGKSLLPKNTAKTQDIRFSTNT